MSASSMCIYTSPLVIPITSEVVCQGAVAMDSRRIVDVGARQRVLERWPQAKTIELSGILMPPLVNAHMHLELAGIDDIPRPGADEPMAVWIAQLLERRQDHEAGLASAGAVADGRRAQLRSGVVLIADICNVLTDGVANADELPEIYRLYEMLAPTAARKGEALKILEHLPPEVPACAHAPYSTAAGLIVALKQRARKMGHVFSCHVAESADERAFLKTASGPFRQFLEQRRSWDGSLLDGGRFDGSIDYLDSLGVLDENTLCVHCVHLDEYEIDILARKNVKVCLCPGSNEFLGVGRAPLEMMLAAGLLPAVGTDSPASNENTDLWREMGLLHRHHPAVPAQTLLAMATYGGAAALRRSADYGSLAPGRKPLLLEIGIDTGSRVNAEEVFKHLVSGRRPQTIRWRTPYFEP